MAYLPSFSEAIKVSSTSLLMVYFYYINVIHTETVVRYFEQDWPPGILRLSRPQTSRPTGPPHVCLYLTVYANCFCSK